MYIYIYDCNYLNWNVLHLCDVDVNVYLSDHMENSTKALNRSGCSKLKAHLHFNLHVEDDPSCICGFGIEDPYHFLFTCPLYAQIRVVMLDSISHIKPDIAPGLPLLLRGDINLTFDQNKAIFEYVQTFIRTSSRF